jgi:hypothetical protein
MTFTIDESTLPEIIFEECIEFDTEEEYNAFVLYCEHYIFDDELTIDQMKHIENIDKFNTFKMLAQEYVEPNFVEKLQRDSLPINSQE